MKKLVKIVLMSAFLLCTMFALTGCMPYDKPELVLITPSQTAFLIPLEGKTSDQKAFMSESFLETAKVATKEVTIPHRWLKEGRFPGDGRHIPTVQLIIVERKPETREWTKDTGSGTSSKDQGITAESKESIGFMAQMNISAQIDEVDAVKFLYRYNNKSLSDVLDTEVRARVESNFVEQCATYSLEDILLNKAKIMDNVRKDVTDYFKEKGISITVLGLKGEFSYLNADIQASIDAKFKSAQALITQKNENERIISKAKADSEAIKVQAETIASTLKQKELDNQAAAITKWDGKMPTYVGGNGSNIFNIPTGSK